MTVLYTRQNMAVHPNKHIRRSATAVMAGVFDPRPPRDVLTSVLNGVPKYAAVERDEEAKLKRKQEKKERERQKKKFRAEKAALKRLDVMGEGRPHVTTDGDFASTSSLPHTPIASSSKQCFVRPTIHIPAIQRSVSVTPSPPSSPRLLASTPGSTPGPSISSSTSRTSSKRLHTPDDDEMLGSQEPSASAPPPRKKRVAARKGWKGWVEGSPPPSTKLILLDVPILQERRTRSGKNFDAIGPGKDNWL